MPLVARTKQASGLKALMNAATFAATFAVLAGSNLPILRAVAAASVSVDASGHGRSASFDIPAIKLAGQAGTSLPAIPPLYDTDLVLDEPKVAMTPARPAMAPVKLAMAPVRPEFYSRPLPVGAPAPRKALPFGLFGSLEFRTNATKGIGAWRQALARLDNEQPLYEFCDIGMLDCPPKYVAWRKLLASLRGVPASEQLARLNRGINGLISYGNDAAVFRVRDHWAAPMEFLQTGGDCEDYTILKYASLLELGYSDQQLRIAVVKDTRRGLDHAVLAVAGVRGVTILDNLTDTPLAHKRIRHYRPVYSVNRRDRWVHIATKQISQLSETSTK